MSLAKTSASFHMDENQQMQAVKKVIMERAATATPHTTFLRKPPRGTRHRRRVKQISKFYHVLQTAVLATKTLFCLYARSQYTAFVSS